MDILRMDNYNKPLSTSCYTELQTDVPTYSTSDQDCPSFNDLEHHLNEGIFLTTESVEEESHFDVTNDDGGILLVWGCGEFGQHGHGHHNDVPINTGATNPLMIGHDGLVTLAACGSSHTVVVTDDDRIFSWGNSNSGQLGIGDTKTTLQPHLVQLGVKPGTRIRGVMCGTRHTFIWTEEGDCFSFGNNFNAQLGYDFRKPDFKDNQLRPVYLENLFNQNVVHVACGSRHSIFLFSSGSVASVGCNDRGQLGLSDKKDSVCIQKVVNLQSISIIACGNFHCLAADNDGIVYAWGYGKACGTKDDILDPTRIYSSDSIGISSLAGGDSHSLLLLDNGKLLSWGNNFEGQLGQGTSIKFQSKPFQIKDYLLEEKMVNISVGENTSAAVSESGRLFMWGQNVSQVIREDEGPRYRQYEPYHVPLGKWKATKVVCGAWHVACIVSPDARPNTWEWTPLHVPVREDAEPMNTQYHRDVEDVSFDKHNYSCFKEENLKVEDKVELNDGHIKKDCSGTNSMLTVKGEKDHSASLGTVDLVQNEMPILDVEISMTKENLKDNGLPLQISEQRKPSLKTDKVCEGDENSIWLTDSKVKHKKVGKPHSKERNSLRRTVSEESVVCNSLCDVRPQRHTKPNHFSKSLYNIELEQRKDEREESSERIRRSSTGTIKGTSRCHIKSALYKNTETKSNNTETLSSTSSSVHADQNHSKPRASTLGTWSPPLPETKFSGSGQGSTGQLNREKKAPRHIRRVPSGPKVEYYLPNQPIQSSDVTEKISQHNYVHKATISRTQSSPDLDICYLQTDVHPLSFSKPATPLTGLHVPHPPPPANGLPPRHPRLRKTGVQKIVFSSGSSWRKRNSNI